MKRALVMGNWKMNLDYVEAVHLVQQLGVLASNRPLDHVDVVVVPPFVDLRSVTSVVESERVPVGVGAQHVNPLESGAHTGEISAPMLRRLGVASVLVGHSERRQMYSMSDDVVAQTLQAATRHGLAGVLCVGESLDVREAGQHLDYVADQLRSALEGLSDTQRELVTIAYEPIWAIGTGLSASTDQVREMTENIRVVASSLSLANARVLYGGSVNAENAGAIVRESGVDGFLVGGASLKAESFWSIGEAVDDCYAGRAT